MSANKVEDSAPQPVFAKQRIAPRRPKPRNDDELAFDGWGFRDSAFSVTADGHVQMRGARYVISGKKLPRLLPWMSRVLGVELDPHESAPSNYPPPVTDPVENAVFIERLRNILEPEQLDTRPEIRLRHGHGRALEDVWAVHHRGPARVPDLVVYPHSEDEAALLVRTACEHDVVLIPYGGGTNVSDALRCPEDEKRMIVSVDLKELNRIRWIDPVEQTAYVEAGAVGQSIQDVLAEHGYTLGHEPDSVELSTLGGWIATNASGMKKNRYGNIEEIVLDVTAVNCDGELVRSCVGPRESVALDLRGLLFGSEGNWALITSATVKVYPLPEVQRYDSVLFHSFEDGVEFAYELTRSEVPTPASVRLVDNLQFQFSQALKTEDEGSGLIARLQKWLVMRVYGFDPARMVACTLVFEGSRATVGRQRKEIRRLARRHRGMVAGPSNGKRGYALTFAIAYIQDFALTRYIVAESFETSVPWRDVLPFCERVKAKVHSEHAQRGLPGRPFVTCRVTQLYPAGVCIYFYLAYYSKGVEQPAAVFAELEHAARDEILAAGGSLSHHHGVGKLRAGFLDRIHSEASLTVLQRVEGALDPGNVFALANHQSDGLPQEPGTGTNTGTTTGTSAGRV